MTEPCTRFEREGLQAYMRDMTLDSHFETCGDCRARREQYARLERDLTDLGLDDRPPANYQARVWARIAERRTATKPWYQRWWWLVLPAPVVAAMAIILALPDERANLDMVELRYDIVQPSDAIRRRGHGTARPGDVLSLHASTGEARKTELRVYRGEDELVLQCSNEPPCERRDGTLLAKTVLLSRGEYQVLLLASDEPLPAPAPSLAHDIAMAEQRGAVIERSEPIEVR